MVAVLLRSTMDHTEGFAGSVEAAAKGGFVDLQQMLQDYKNNEDRMKEGIFTTSTDANDATGTDVSSAVGLPTPPRRPPSAGRRGASQSSDLM